MSSEPEVAIIIPTYQRPENLRRVLMSVALQQGVANRIEVVVADDGSTDETPEIVRQFAKTVGFPVRFTTHPHTVYHPARSRNEGVAASSAAYLLFLDGDCVMPPDHVTIHLHRRRQGVAMLGDSARMDQMTSARIDEAIIRSGDYQHWAPAAELQRLRKQHRKAMFYWWRRHPVKPKLISNNVGIWRTDYERINGFDERYRGWGCEDDDLGFRLRRAGVRIRSILGWTRTYHLWHPVEATCTATWSDGPNVAYLKRQGALLRCRDGLVKRPLEDLRFRVVGEPATAKLTDFVPPQILSAVPRARDLPEVEILFLPGTGKFSGRAQCNVLVELEESQSALAAAQKAHVVVANRKLPAPRAHHWFPLNQWQDALDAVA